MTGIGAARAGIVRIGIAVSFLLAASSCVSPVATVPESERQNISSALMRDINILASDEFGGRKPGTEGEQRTLGFIIDELQKAGFESGTNDPGNPWRAPVRLIRTEPSESSISFGVGSVEHEVPVELGAAFTTRQLALVEGADVIYVGKESEDVSEELVIGKVVVMLGEPGVSPARRENLFEKQPAAIVTVIEDADAIAQLRNFAGRERFVLASEDASELSVFMTQDAVGSVLGEERWAELRELADDDGFEPIDLTVAATIEATSQRSEFTSSNVVGRLPGTSPASGAILLLAHWDHLGDCGDEDSEDRICNGAVDNASGIAMMIELSRRLAANGPYERDIYILATTAEESGLLGAKAFVEAPAIPLDTIIAAFNFDTVAVAPAGSSVGFVGEGRTPLDTIISDVMRAGRRDLGDQELAASFIQRQDGWALLQEGVPAVMLSTAFSSRISLGPYLSEHYHQSSDEIEIIELGGAIDDLLLHQELVMRLANTATYPSP
ncbi:MAG: M20/M25/M40 family metallo-hydrolase [Erythrobacter sp.]